jgi:hypothetical protein
MTVFHDYWLKGTDEADVQSALAAAGIPLLPTETSSYDLIGTIWVPGPDVDEDGNPIPVPLPGWHANLRMRDKMTFPQRSALESILIPQPQHPVRVWAGAEE